MSVSDKLREYVNATTPVRNIVIALIAGAAAYLTGKARQIPFDKGQGPGDFKR